MNEPFPLQPAEDKPDFTARASDACLKLGEIPGMSAEEQHRGAKVIFELLHERLSVLPMGAPMDEKSYETLMKTAIGGVKKRLEKDHSYAIACAIDPFTLISLAGAFFKILGWIIEWWKERK